MPWFDNPAIYARRLSDYALDTYLYFIYIVCMIVLPFVAGAPSTQQEFLVALLITAILISISYAYRRRMHWHWPGVRPKEILAAFLRLLPLPIFALAAIPILPPQNRQFFPVYLFWAGIMLYLALFYLKIIPPSQTAFLQQCRPAASVYATTSAPFATPASAGPRVRRHC